MLCNTLSRITCGLFTEKTFRKETFNKKKERKGQKKLQFPHKISPFFWKLVLAPQLWGRVAVVAGSGRSWRDPDCSLRENWEILGE